MANEVEFAALAEKPLTPLQEAFVEWLGEVTGFECEPRSVQLAMLLRGEFQASEWNKQWHINRREAKEADAANRKEERKAEAARKKAAEAEEKATADPKPAAPAKKAAAKKAKPASNVTPIKASTKRSSRTRKTRAAASEETF